MATQTTEWVADQREQAIKSYKNNPTPETVSFLAEGMDKSERQVIAVLSRAGVYVKAAKNAKRGETKDSLIARIASKLGVAESLCEGLAMVRKDILLAILARIDPAPVDAAPADAVPAEV